MGVEIPITGITDSFRPPGVWSELLVAQGQGAANVGEREAVAVAPILSTGNWTAAVLEETETEQDFIDGAAARKCHGCQRCVGAQARVQVRGTIQDQLEDSDPHLWLRGLGILAASHAGWASH